MKVLVATNDKATHVSLEQGLAVCGYEAVPAPDLSTVLLLMAGDDSPQLVLVDLDTLGAEAGENIRSHTAPRTPYIIALTTEAEDSAPTWADDSVVWPDNPSTLASRLRLGERIIKLESDRGRLTQELEVASHQVALLQGFIPICAWCKKIRDDSQYWQEIDDYLHLHCDTAFTHSICPSCLSKKFSEILDKTP